MLTRCQQQTFVGQHQQSSGSIPMLALRGLSAVISQHDCILSTVGMRSPVNVPDAVLIEICQWRCLSMICYLPPSCHRLSVIAIMQSFIGISDAVLSKADSDDASA